MSNVYQLTVGGADGGGNFFENVFHYLAQESGAHTAYIWARDIAIAWQGSVLGLYRDCLAQDATFNILSCKRVTGGGGLTAVRGVALPGNFPADTLVGTIAPLVTWIPDDPSTHKGRTFMPAVPQGAIEVDQLVDPYLSALQAYAAAQQSVLALGGDEGTATFVVFNRTSLVSYEVVDAYINGRISTQRKRTMPIV